MNSQFLTQHGGRVATVLVVAGAIAYAAFGFFPRRAAIAELRREAEEKTRSALQAQRALQEIASVSEELNQAQRYASAWRAASPEEEGTIAFFREINQLAEASQTRNLRLEPAATENLAVIWRVPVELVVEGSFSQLFRLVKGLESASLSLWLSSVTIEPLEADSPTLRMTATLTIFGAKPEFSDYVNLAD